MCPGRTRDATRTYTQGEYTACTSHEWGNVSIENGRTARLNMRLTPQALQLIREAAAAQSQDVTSFVLGAALDRARAVLTRQRELHP